MNLKTCMMHAGLVMGYVIGGWMIPRRMDLGRLGDHPQPLVEPQFGHE